MTLIIDKTQKRNLIRLIKDIFHHLEDQQFTSSTTKGGGDASYHKEINV